MNKQTLIDLGFERFDETPQNSCSDVAWYYYTLSIGDITLISNESDIAGKYGWNVGMFNSETLRVTDSRSLEKLIAIIHESTIR